MNNTEAYAYIWEVPGRVVESGDFSYQFTKRGGRHALLCRHFDNPWVPVTSDSNFFQPNTFEPVERELPDVVLEAIKKETKSQTFFVAEETIARKVLDAINYEY